MSTIKYLYIDDESDSSVSATKDGFNDLKIIEVFIEQPQDFASQRAHLIKQLSSYSGLILDYRLDGNMQLNVSYNAPAIAAELISLMNETDANKKIKPCPIIICSTDERMGHTYDTDKVIHELFDYKFLKGIDPLWEKMSKKLASLAKGYDVLNEMQTKIITTILNREDLSGVNPKIFERFTDAETKLSVRDYSHFIVKELFNHPGALVKETLMASRLGIDCFKSGDSWNELKERFLLSAKYTGLFSDGWDRWWMDSLNSLFKAISEGRRLPSLSASERVEFLSTNTGIKGLVHAEPLPFCNSSNFWTICEETKKPLDPLEGFRAYESIDLKPWQEQKYISFNAIAQEGLTRKGLRPHSSENERIKLTKEQFAKK